MKVYIAGPMTGIEDYNYPAFNAAEEALQAWGYETVNPAKLDEVTTLDLLDAGLDPDAPGGLGEGSALPVYLRRDFSELVGCQGLVLLRGWRYSPGANAELAVARWLDFHVWDLADDGKELWMVPSAALPNIGVVQDTWHRFAQPRYMGQRAEARARARRQRNAAV